MNTKAVHCYRCGKEIPETNLGRQDSCEACGADTRVCKNCKNFDPKANNMCREEQAPRVVDKEKGNFCEWFQARKGPVDAAGGATASSLKSAADALFGKKSTGGTPGAGGGSSVDAAKAAAEALFKKKS